MAYTFYNAYTDLQKARQQLNTVEEDYIYITEKILKRELFHDGHLVKKAELGSISKMELAVIFNKLEKAYIKYISLSLITEKLRKERDNNERAK